MGDDNVSLSVIIPALNEEASIGGVIKKVRDVLDKANIKYEILVIDGESKDKTADIARKEGAIVIEERKRGYGRAYKTGFLNAKMDWILTLDADGTYEVGKIPEYLQYAISNKLDFITFRRVLHRNAMSTKNKIGNAILNISLYILFLIRVKDSQSGMWLIRTKAIPSFHLKSDGMAFSEEIKIEAFMHSRAKELNVDYYERIGEPKLLAWRDGFKNLFFLFKKRVKHS
ncbi:MAG: glycosyltransferase family 2 protein [Thermoplasmata archaeon]